VDLRNIVYKVFGRKQNGEALQTRFCDTLLLCGSEVRSYHTKECGTLGSKSKWDVESGQTIINSRLTDVTKDGGAINTPMAWKKSEIERSDDLRYTPLKVGTTKCTKITVFSEKLTPVYDIENTGNTHTFFALTDKVNGCLIAKNCLDELNYMSVIEKSKSSVDGGTFDQAIALYNSISRRRKSRFQSSGALPGILCLVSSKRYPGQFTDIKEEEAKRDKTIYIYDKRVWDIKPPGSFCGEFFDVFCGDESRKPRIMRENDFVNPEDRHLVDHIPVEFKEDFEKDIINALREIAGKSTLARHPFILNTEAITVCMNRNDSIFSTDSVDFVSDQLFILPDNFKDPHLPRAAHIDLGITGDSAGLCIATVTGFERVIRSQDEIGEMLPKYHVDGCLEVRPPKGGEILFWKIRNILYLLRDQGLNIRWVTLDTFQSKDTMQILKQKGFFTGMISMDTSTLPYELTKSALYDSRITMPIHDKLRRELASLEMDSKKGKIDHPSVAGASKDCADALAGALSCLISRREVWGNFGIPPAEFPDTVRKNAPKVEAD
jgi:hypothetical protein